MVDGDWSVLDCYKGWTDVAAQDNVYLDLQEGIADIHFAEILVSTTSGACSEKNTPNTRIEE